MSLEQTNQQERASAWFFHQALNKNKSWARYDDFMNDKVAYFNEVSNIYPALKALKNPRADQKSKSFARYWLECYLEQTKQMTSRFSATNFTSFNHGSEHTYGAQEKPSFMEWVTKVINKKYGISQKDTWDPADIWCIRNLKGVVKELQKATGPSPEEPAKDSPPTGTIDQFNDILIKLFNNAKSGGNTPAVVGISLKLVSKQTVDDVVGFQEDMKDWEKKEGEYKKQLAAWLKQNPTKKESAAPAKIKNLNPGKQPKMKKISVPVAHYEEVNVNKNMFKSQEFVQGCILRHIYFDLGFGKEIVDDNGKTVKSFNTQDTKVSIVNSFTNEGFTFQIKPNGTSDFNNLKFEPSPDDKGAARLGKAPLEQVGARFREVNLGFSNDHKPYPKDLTQLKAKEGDYTTKWNFLNAAASAKPFNGILDKGALGPNAKTFMDNIKKGYKVQPQIAMSKLMQLDFIYHLVKLGKSDSKKGEGFNKMNTLLTDMVFLAQKKNRNASMHFGPFGKIY